MITNLLKAAWTRWKIIAYKIGDLQARVLLSLFYFLVLAPFAAVLKLSSDPLGLRSGTLGGWARRQTAQGDLAAQARRQS